MGTTTQIPYDQSTVNAEYDYLLKKMNIEKLTDDDKHVYKFVPICSILRFEDRHSFILSFLHFLSYINIHDSLS